MTLALPSVRGTLTPGRPLADLTWLRVGGPADWLFQPADEADLSAFLRDLDFTRQQRDKTTVSLLETRRRAEREQIEAWQRERENRYRIAKGLPLLKPGDEIPEGKDSAIPDAALEESARIVGLTLAEVAKHIKPGVPCQYLDRIAEEFIRDHHAVPSFKGYNGYPASLCISINDVVVHGIPHSNDGPVGNLSI